MNVHRPLLLSRLVLPPLCVIPVGGNKRAGTVVHGSQGASCGITALERETIRAATQVGGYKVERQGGILEVLHSVIEPTPVVHACYKEGGGVG